MGQHWLFDMPTVLQAAGLDVATHPGWELRSRSTGGLDAILGIVAHHDADATSGNDADAERYMWDNAASRPIGNVHLRRSGMWVVGAAGAANTAGKGGPVTGSQGTVALNQGNRYTINVEAANNGIGETWSRIQVDSYLTGLAAMCEHWDLDRGRDIWTHAGYCEPSCPGRKVDPAGPTPSHPSLGGTSGRATWSQTALRDLTAAVLIPKPLDPETPPVEPPPITNRPLEAPMLFATRVNETDGSLNLFALGSPLVGWRSVDRTTLTVFLQSGQVIDLASGRTGFKSGDSLTAVSATELERLLGKRVA